MLMFAVNVQECHCADGDTKQQKREGNDTTDQTVEKQETTP